MERKKLIFTLIFVFISVITLGSLFIISIGLDIKTPEIFIPSENNDKEDENDSETVDLENPDSSLYDISFIAEDGSLRLRDFEGDDLTITLQDNNWKELSWSFDASTLAFLGDYAGNGIFNLFLYSLENKEFKQVTFYELENDSITSFVWKDEASIYYSSGVAPDNWLHEYSLSDGGLQKIERVDGFIKTSSQLGNYFVYILNTRPQSFEVRALDTGEVISRSDSYNITSEFEFIAELFPTDNEDKFLLTLESFSETSFHKASKADLTSVDISKEYIFNPVCVEGRDSVLGYIEDEIPERLALVRFDTKTEVDTRVIDFDISKNDISRIFLDTFVCSVGEPGFFFRAEQIIESENQDMVRKLWYKYDGNTIEKADSDLLDTDIKSFNFIPYE